MRSAAEAAEPRQRRAIATSARRTAPGVEQGSGRLSNAVHGRHAGGAFTVDTGHLRWRTLRQPGLLDIVGDGRCMIIVHVLNHAPLHLAILDSEGIGQGDVVQPVNCTETT